MRHPCSFEPKFLHSYIFTEIIKIRIHACVCILIVYMFPLSFKKKVGT